MRLGQEQIVERVTRDFEDRLERLEKRGRMASNPVGEFLVVSAADGKGAQISFVLRVARGVDQVLVLRNFSLDAGSAVAIQTYDARSIGENKTITYTDADPAIAGKTVYYWLRIVPFEVDQKDALLVGPQRFNSNVDTSAPDAIPDFDASHQAASGGLVSVGVAFKPPKNDRFGSCKIYVAGYKGVAASVAIAQNETSPFSFPLEQTGESITLRAVAVSRTGVEASLTGAPSKTLTLGAAATVPAKIMGVTATELTTGVQIGFPTGPEGNLTAFKIYRNTKGSGFATATQIGTVIPQSGTSAYTFLDTNGLTGSFEWYVVATNGAGNSPASDAATTIAFSTTADLPPNAPGNFTNYATVDSIDAGTSATIRIYGTGGVGTAWTRVTGFGTQTYPAGTITGKAYSTTYYVMWNGSAYIAVTILPDTVPDGYVWVGKVTTVASGGGGGSSGGGGGSGGSGGCCEVGTPLAFSRSFGTEISQRIEPCSEWVEMELESGRKLSVARNTLISTFVPAQVLIRGDLVELEGGRFEAVKSRKFVTRSSEKIVVEVSPGGTYYANGIRVHNLKPVA